MNPHTPITESDLHAWIDGQLRADRAREVEADRAREVEAYLAARPGEARRAEAWRAQKEELRALFDTVQDEPLNGRLLRAPAWPKRSRGTSLRRKEARRAMPTRPSVSPAKVA